MTELNPCKRCKADTIHEYCRECSQLSPIYYGSTRNGPAPYPHRQYQEFGATAQIMAPLRQVEKIPFVREQPELPSPPVKRGLFARLMDVFNKA